MKKILILLSVFISLDPLYAQQFGLYNSRTLYDVFENPSQSAYQIDTSRRISFNFFIPTFTVNGSFTGSAARALKTLIYEGKLNADNIPVGQNGYNTLTVNTNTYIAMLRILKTVKKSREFGISWQIRNDGQIKATNETLAIFDNYRLFSGNSFQGLFNNKGYNQSYHQFSLVYRQDYNKRLALGAKASLLSGITYTAFKAFESALNIDSENDRIEVNILGGLRSSFKFDNFDSTAVYPNFKNPGLSFTGSASYKFRNGWFVLGNLKDIGFIKWSKDSYEYNFKAGNIIINDASNSSADNRLADSIDQRISNSVKQRYYFSSLNGKAEVLINKDFGNYQPNLILSKSLYYDGGNVVLTNNYRVKDLVFTLSADYNTGKFLAVGGQFMVKSPNTEFFLGSDHLLKSFQAIGDARRGSSPYSPGYLGASFYMGFGMKFGRILEHPANANNIPGFDRKSDGGFLRRIFKKKG
ncbi:MAG: DUF5723 family protein [Daejeonella sp.]